MSSRKERGRGRIGEEEVERWVETRYDSGEKMGRGREKEKEKGEGLTSFLNDSTSSTISLLIPSMSSTCSKLAKSNSFSQLTSSLGSLHTDIYGCLSASSHVIRS